MLPTFDEAENLPLLVPRLLSLQIPGIRLSVLVVDDNSPDGTGQIADELAAATPGHVAVLHRPRREGLGRAYVAGFQRALRDGADLVVQMDADFSHRPCDLIRLVDGLSVDGLDDAGLDDAGLDDAGLEGAGPQRADMVLGSRGVPGSQLDENWGWWRRLLTGFANHVYVRAILGLRLGDATGGYRLWRRSTLIGMDIGHRICSNGFVFQVEMAYLARRLGYRIREVPITFPDRVRGHSKMTGHVAVEAALRTWQVWWRHHELLPSARLALDLSRRLPRPRAVAHP